jgi:polysaccharide export outer membrane protein
VLQYNSRSFFIQGSVNRPGVYQIEGRPSLLKLITIAGGLSGTHGSTAFIIREIKSREATVEETNADREADEEDEPKYELIKANINGLFKGSFDQDIIINPGDIVNIPPTDVFFVAGEVNAPGSFPLNDGTTLRQAISLAQGTTFKAAPSRGVIFREDQVARKRQEIRVDIAAVMNGKRGDVPLMPNDTIIVPHSRAKSVTAHVLNAFGYGFIRLVPALRRY